MSKPYTGNLHPVTVRGMIVTVLIKDITSGVIEWIPASGVALLDQYIEEDITEHNKVHSQLQAILNKQV